MASPLTFLYSHLLFTPPYPATTFKDKTVIITGANRGLGLEATRHFVRLGASKVIMAVRTVSKGEEAKASVVQSEKCHPDVIDLWTLDLTSFQSVKDFAKKINTLPRLDALVANAGIVTEKFGLAEGHEKTVTTNVISTFLLGFLTLPKMKATASRFKTRPHLTIVTSEVHHWTQLPERNSPSIFQTLDQKEGANMQDRYNVTKLLEVFTVREILSSIIKDKDAYPVIINMVNPGMCHSELTDELGLPVKIIKFLLARKTEVGSRTLVHAAGAGDASQGEYLSDCKVDQPSPFVRSEEGVKTQQRVWEELRGILEEVEPGVTKLI